MSQWWSWAILGLLLLCAELFVVDAQFYIVFIGLGALIVGLIALLLPGMPTWVSWLLFAILSLTSMFTIRKQLYERLRGRVTGLGPPDVGEHVTVADDLPPGQTCRTEYRGSQWTAVNAGDATIPAGASARIDSVDGLRLNIKLN